MMMKRRINRREGIVVECRKKEVKRERSKESLASSR